MSDKVKKQASSLSFSLSKWFRKISTAKPSTFLTTVALLGVAVFLFSGGLYDLIVQPLPSLYYNQKFYFLYPELSQQFLFDTVLSAMLYVIGFIGLLSIYQSSKHAYNPRQAYMTMMIGATLLIIAYVFLEYFIRLKVSGA
jgi:phosphotransferase system  glucose/maltose/N-acetylglucosamine-specific IIC component